MICLQSNAEQLQKAYFAIPRMKETIQENYNRIKAEVRQIVADELQRIQNNPALAHLLQIK